MSAVNSSSVTVRIPVVTHELLKQLASQYEKTLQDVIVHLVEREADRRFFNQAKIAYEAMSKNHEAIKEESARRELLDKTLLDGLEEYTGANKSNPNTRRRVGRAVR